MRCLLTLTLLVLPVLGQDTPRRQSSFGNYEGYSKERFDSWETGSVYVEMRDGVRLAVDISLPTRDGVAASEALPLVWTHSRYHRRMGGVPMPDLNSGLQRLLRHGYAVASVGVRGSGASFGTYEGLFSEAETLDAIEMIEWFAEQSFCDGNIGMYGGSYLGITQYMAASRAPEALKAIYPDVAALDMYEIIHPGAVFRQDLLEHWAGLTALLDTQLQSPTVDGDERGELRSKAIAEHEGNWDVMKEYSAGPYRDRDVPTLSWRNHGPIGCLEEIQRAKVPTYHSNGWYDVFALDAVLWFANFEGPQRMVMGDWSHAQLSRERRRVTDIEQHRWFDRWLKGIENGVESEPRIQYALMIEPGEMVWRAADHWPPAGLEKRVLHLGGGPSETVDSVNDGHLVARESALDAFDEYVIDPTTTTGDTSRWDNAVGAAPVMEYGGLAENDTKCLTYTSAPLEEELALVGHPVLSLWLTAEAGDGNLHVVLEEVDARGEVRYVTEGVLRASQRKLSDAPFDNLGLPYQRCFEEDAEVVPAQEPVEVRMDLHPTATVFNRGHRMRVSLMGADADNTEDARCVGKWLRLHRGLSHDSRIEFSVLP